VRHPVRGELWLEGHSMPVREPDGGTVWHGVATDITERKQAEEELRRRAGELARANEELMRYNRVLVGRELRMIELKKEVDELSQRLGQSPPFRLEFAEGAELPGT
jgi:hypothetical protein